MRNLANLSTLSNGQLLKYNSTTSKWANSNYLALLGSWDASTNTPITVLSVGIGGTYYKIFVSGTTNIDSNSTWSVGDIVLFTGSVW